MSTIPGFGKIFTYGDARAMSRIKGGQLRFEITEKVDGSQFAFAKIEGKLVVRSKGQMFDPGAPPQLFAPAVGHIKSIASGLPEGRIHYGEAFMKPKHNTLAYASVPRGHVALFGVVSEERYLEWSDVRDIAVELKIQPVPLLADGIWDGSFDLNHLLEGASILGGVQREGVVLRFPDISVKYPDGKYPYPLMLKHVRSSFKEKHTGTRKEKGSEVYALFDQWRTDARWTKAIQHLRDAGHLKGRMSDMPFLIEEVGRDIEEEDGPVIREALWALYRKKFRSHVTSGLAPFYKAWLGDNWKTIPGDTEETQETENGKVDTH